MKTKTIPAIFMLLGGAVAVISTYINGYELIDMLKVLLVSLIIFLIIGFVAKIIIDKYVPYIEELDEEVETDEGSFMEKTGDDEAEDLDEGVYVVAEGETTEEP